VTDRLEPLPPVDTGRAGTVRSGAMDRFAAPAMAMSIPMDPMMGSGRGVGA